MDWPSLLAYITGRVDQELLLRNEYLAAENRILRAKIKGRLQLSDGEKSTLAEIAASRCCTPPGLPAAGCPGLAPAAGTATRSAAAVRGATTKPARVFVRRSSEFLMVTLLSLQTCRRRPASPAAMLVCRTIL